MSYYDEELAPYADGTEGALRRERLEAIMQWQEDWTASLRAVGVDPAGHLAAEDDPA